MAPVQPRADVRGLSLVVQRAGQQQALGYAQDDLWPVSGSRGGDHIVSSALPPELFHGGLRVSDFVVTCAFE